MLVNSFLYRVNKGSFLIVSNVRAKKVEFLAIFYVNGRGRLIFSSQAARHPTGDFYKLFHRFVLCIVFVDVMFSMRAFVYGVKVSQYVVYIISLFNGDVSTASNGATLTSVREDSRRLSFLSNVRQGQVNVHLAAIYAQQDRPRGVVTRHAISLRAIVAIVKTNGHSPSIFKNRNRQRVLCSVVCVTISHQDLLCPSYEGVFKYASVHFYVDYSCRFSRLLQAKVRNHVRSVYVTRFRPSVHGGDLFVASVKGLRFVKSSNARSLSHMTTVRVHCHAVRNSK